jgi:hypothetical protein
VAQKDPKAQAHHLEDMVPLLNRDSIIGEEKVQSRKETKHTPVVQVLGR